LEQKTEAIVNTVNCVGVMGRGIALSFREAYPENYREYKKACAKGEVVPGRMFVHFAGDMFSKKYIINFPTKRHWREKSRIEDIRSGLADLVSVIRELHIKSVTIPPLGCGLGGLDWKVVRPIIESSVKELSGVEINIIEPEPSFKIQRQKTARSEKNKLTDGRAGLIVLIGRYLEAMMDTSVTLLELHKLMYFLQEAGKPLRLNYEKALYGPYASNLRHVLDIMNNVYISGYNDREDNPEKEIDLLDNSFLEAQEYLSNKPEIMKYLHKVSSLISGFETPFGMELLSTVHWVAKRENAETPDRAVILTHEWNSRKKMFSEKQIKTAWEKLKSQEWI